MKTWTLLFATAALLLVPLWARSAELNRIERRIVKEPAYQSKDPRYCLLVFGADAKTRIWIVQDGDCLYVDRNGNGDLTEKDKKVTLKDGKVARSFEAGGIKADGLTHTGLRVVQMKASPEFVGNDKEMKRIKRASPESWIWTVGIAAERSADDKRDLPKRIKYIVNGDGLGMLVFGDRPETAPIIHFNGPWTIGLQDLKQRLTPGEKAMLQIGIGTQGVGPGTFTFVLYPDTIPNDAYPVAKVTYPAKSLGDVPIVESHTLKQRC
jgi:hypothetical protein